MEAEAAAPDETAREAEALEPADEAAEEAEAGDDADEATAVPCSMSK